MTGRWLARVFREAAWPGVVVFFAHLAFGAWLGHEPYVDPVAHFSGGAAAAFFFSRLPALAPDFFGALAAATRRLLAFGLTTVVAVDWELLELLSDRYLGTHAHTSVAGTLRDLLDGMLGALAFLIVEAIVERRARR